MARSANDLRDAVAGDAAAEAKAAEEATKLAGAEEAASHSADSLRDALAQVDGLLGATAASIEETENLLGKLTGAETEAGAAARAMAVAADDAADDTLAAFEAAKQAVEDYERGLMGLAPAQAAVTKAMDAARNAAALEAEALNLARAAAAEQAGAATASAAATGSAARAFAEEAVTARAAAEAVSDLAHAEMDEVGAAMAEAAAWRGTSATIGEVVKGEKDLAAALHDADMIGAADDAGRLAESMERLATAADVVKARFGDATGAFTDADRAIADDAKAATAATGFWARWGQAIHWVISGSIEFLATAVPAMVAFGAAALVGMQGASMLQEHLTALWTAAEALGGAFGTTMGKALGLKDVLQQAQDAANPDIYALLGAGLGILKSQAGGMAEAGLKVIQIFDEFAAHLRYDFTSAGGAGKTMSALLGNMVPDLVEFGQVLGNLGHAVANLASKMPGLAELLLKLLDAASKAVEWFSTLPTPLIMTAMAMEEIWRWGQPLAAILTRLPALIEGFAASGFGVVPVLNRMAEVFRALIGVIPNLIADFSELAASAASGTVFEGLANAVEGFSKDLADGIMEMTKFEALAGVALIAAIVGVGVALDRTRSSTQQFVDSMNKAVSSASQMTVLNTLSAAIGGATSRISAQEQVLNRYSPAMQHYAEVNAQGAASLDHLMGPLAGVQRGAQNFSNAANTWIGHAISWITTIKGLGNAYMAMTGANGAGKAALQIEQLTAAQKQWLQASVNVVQGAAAISHEYGVNLPGALALAQQAGVKLQQGYVGMGQDAQIARLQVADLVAGYQAMGQTSTAIAGDMDVLAVQSALAGTKVQQLTQATEQYMQEVTGGTAGLAGYVQSIQNLGTVVGKAGTGIGNLGNAASINLGKVSTFAASLKNMSGQGAQAWTNFDQVVGQTLPNLIGWFQTAGAMGVLSGKQIKQGTLDALSGIVPYAQGNKAAEASVLALARTTLGTSITWSQLSDSIKSTHASLSAANEMVQEATVKMGNLMQVAQNLSNVMSTSIIQTMDQAKLAASGLSGAASTLANDLSRPSTPASTLSSDIQHIYDTVMRLTGSKSAAQSTTQAYSDSFGKAGQAAFKAWQQVSTDAPKIPKAMQSAINQGAPGVQAAATHMAHGVYTGVIGEALPSKMQTEGTKTAQGMNTGLHSGSGGIMHWPMSVNDWISQGLNSLPGTLAHLGEMAGEGLARGLSDAEGAIASAASALAHAIPSTVARLLASASPSKVMMQQGQFAVDGLVKGLTGGISQIKAAVRKIVEEVHKDLYAGLTGWEWAKAKIADPLLQMIQGDNTKLQALANQRKKIASEIKAATQYAATTSSSLISATGLAGVTQPTNATTGATLPYTVPGIQSQMTTQLNQLKAFDHNIDVLKKMGLNKTLLNQIIAAGYQQGGALAQSLAHGSESQIKSLNSTENAIIAASKKIGKDAADALYDTGKKAGQGFLSGLKSQEKAIDNEMTKIAKDLVKAIKKELKIKSPSQEMHDTGMFAAQGLANGLLAGEPIVLAAAKKLAAAAGGVKVTLPPPQVAHAGSPVIQVGTAPVAGVAQPMIVHQHIAGSVLSEQQLQQYVQTAQLKYTRRNLGNGLFLQGRASGTPAR
jgi:hypothetical protein